MEVVALQLFLAMSQMSMDLSSLAGAFGKIFVVLAVQAIVITFFVVHIVFRVMGKDYDGTGAVEGGFWGTLVGTLFLSPLFGAAVGASAGALSGTLSDAGISDEFMKGLAEKLSPNSSMLFVLVREATPDKVVEEIKKFGGTVVHTSLSHEDEDRLQAALSESVNS